MDSPEKPEMRSQDRLESKGEPEEAAAEIESGGRRKEIADEACMKLCVWRSQDQDHRLMKSGEKQSSLDRKIGAFLFYMENRAVAEKKLSVLPLTDISKHPDPERRH